MKFIKNTILSFIKYAFPFLVLVAFYAYFFGIDVTNAYALNIVSAFKNGLENIDPIGHLSTILNNINQITSGIIEFSLPEVTKFTEIFDLLLYVFTWFGNMMVTFFGGLINTIVTIADEFYQVLSAFYQVIKSILIL